ncbi:hypothetical protein [Oligella sp. HMSC09E12]|uniref:hypothetical protein n=1 Tax=Oligella sp. HMSC09E12 TaxID=1581147 RepID=UPI0008A412D4|nr:hypothetical protein [Oligella sp. HMSC09E12]OFV47480.1 hypothetical protein HMPREF3179_08215 [Oligella sp. HMSC09E12]
MTGFDGTSDEFLKDIEQEKLKLIDLVAQGEIALDGVMSPLTKELMQKLGAQGVDMTSWWAMTSMDWHCPSCGRHKGDIVRLNSKRELMCWLVEHHDHMGDLVKIEFEEQYKMAEVPNADKSAFDYIDRLAQVVAAYDKAIICVDCNEADRDAKRIANTHKHFSYSPLEIRRFVEAKPNVKHVIKHDVAQEIWESHKETFELRLKIIRRIADIALNTHDWFQKIPHTQLARAVTAQAENIAKKNKVSSDFSLLTKKLASTIDVNYSSWRYKANLPPLERPNEADIAYITNVTNLDSWSKVSEDWVCPGCHRKKLQTVRKNNKGKWFFETAKRTYLGKDIVEKGATKIICKDCAILTTKLGEEAARTGGLEIFNCFGDYVAIEEVNSIVKAQEHTMHNVDNYKTDSLIAVIVERMRVLNP